MTHNIAQLDGLQTRTMPATLSRAKDDADGKTIVGIAVPYGQEITLCPGLRETFAPGAVTQSDDLLFWRHSEPIGRIINHRHTPTGWEITARISDTQLGRDAIALLNDGAIRSLSIGFESLKREVSEETSDQTLVTHTEVRAREVSLVPHPAYSQATITEHRHERPTPMPDTATADLAQLRAELDQLRTDNANLYRDITLLRQTATDATPSDPFAHRSAGAVLAALARGDQPTTDAYNALLSRDYSGSTTADTITRPNWMGDLTKIVDTANPIMGLFSKGVLPATGLTLEYGRLATNTITADKQSKEGADLAGPGKLTFTTESTRVETYGGYTTLTVQEIERSSIPVLDMSLRAQALQAGVAIAKAFAAHLKARITANASSKIVVSDMADWTKWLAGLVEAGEKYRLAGLNMDGIIADKASFLAIASMKDTSGRPLMVLNGDGTNSVGSLSMQGPKGQLLSVTVYCDYYAAANQVCLYSAEAIRAYQSPLQRLQDANVINLSRDFSVYQYLAIADEQPHGIVPITKA